MDAARNLRRCAAIGVLAASTGLSTPTLTSVSPPGAQRGTAVRLVLDGAGLGGKLQLHSEIPGSLAELSVGGKSRQYLLEVNADAAPGAYSLAVETDTGLSNTWLFSVSAFPETTESESQAMRGQRNDTVGRAQAIETPVVVNGTLGKADRDVYRVHLESGQRIVFEVEARRLGSAIDPVVTVRGPNGTVIERSNDAPGIGQDARVDLTAKGAGAYSVEVYDARFSDQRNNFYRLLAGPIEYAEAIYPLGWSAGAAVDVELSGGTLARPRTVKVAGDKVAIPGEHSGLPVPFLRGSGRETLEPKSRKRRVLSDGVVVNGRIGAAGEVDSYRLAVKEGEEWMVETEAAILGTSKLYTLLVMRDQDGRKLASAGDQPPAELLSSTNTRAETFGDPSIGVRVPEGVSTLELSIEDLLGRGGPGYAYRLVARRQPPDFILRLNDTHVNVPRDGSTSVSFTLDRRGFAGPLRIVAEGVPEDVVVEGGHVPAEFGGMTTQRESLRGSLVFTAPAGVEPGRYAVSFFGEGLTEDGRVVRRPARISRVVTPVAGEGQRPVRVPKPSGSVDTVITAPAPAALAVDGERSLRLIQGLEHDVAWTYTARSSGVRVLAPVRLVNAPAVANLRILGGAKVKPGDKTGVFEMNTTMGTPAMRFDLFLTTNVRYEGATYTVSSKAITVDIVQGYSVGAPQERVVVAPGSEFTMQGAFSREPEFDSTVVVSADNLPVGVTCDQQTIDDSPPTYSLACRAAADVEPGEYAWEVAPRSVLAGRGTEAVPYNITPVEAILEIGAGHPTEAANRPPGSQAP